VAHKLSQSQMDGLRLLLLGGMVFILFGIALENSASTPQVDFRMMYFPARCFLDHHDPYNASNVSSVYLSEGDRYSLNSNGPQPIITQYVYPPTAFLVTLPVALLPWAMAKTVWLFLTFLSLILAAVFIWHLSENQAPILAGLLAGWLLANSESLAITGTIAGIAMSLAIASIWCITRERFIPAGILFLAVSLMVKPQDTALIWLYLFLAGGVYRKRALQALAAATALSLPIVLSLWAVAPHWLAELRANLAFFFAIHGINTPGLASAGAHGIAKIVSLQAILAVIHDDPRFYNPASYLLCAPLLIIWAWKVLHLDRSIRNAMYSLAAAAPLSLLPTYHRLYDTKLLLLVIPACAMQWSKSRKLGGMVLACTAVIFILTSDIVNAALYTFSRQTNEIAPALTIAVQIFLVPFFLFVTGIVYLSLMLRNGESSCNAAVHKGS